MANDALPCKVTRTERREFLRLASLLIPGYVPPEPTAEELAERARLDAEKARLDEELAEYRRRFPRLAKQEDELFAKLDEEIRREVLARREVEP